MPFLPSIILAIFFCRGSFFSSRSLFNHSHSLSILLYHNSTVNYQSRSKRKEQEAKNALMSTAVGQKMSVYKRIERLLPHEMTTKLFEEMANLRLKRTGVSTDIVLEQINARYPKDKYSSFAYGLYRIKELEEEYTKKRRRRLGNGEGGGRKLTFFS